MPEIPSPPGSFERRRPDGERPEARVFVSRTDERRRVATLLAVALLLGGILGGLGYLLGRLSGTPQVVAPPAAPDATEGPPSDVPAEKDLSPPKLEPNRVDAAPASPGDLLTFEDVEHACGDLTPRRNFLCLLNRGTDLVGVGIRQAVDESLAKFSIAQGYKNVVSIEVEGKIRYSLLFGPAEGKPLIPGFYAGALSSGNKGPYPRLEVSENSYCEVKSGRFIVLENTQTGDGKVLRFVADFDSGCNGAIGRISIIRAEVPVKPKPPIDIRPHELAGDSTR